MRVVLAKNAGFCMGVRRALNIVIEVVNEKKDPDELIFTYGPLIHNSQVVEFLATRGVQIINHPSEINKFNKPASVIIRSHGISPEVRNALIKTGILIYDATCPRVTKVQSIIKKYYENHYDIVIVGDKGHAEVTGLLGFSENKGHVISTKKEALLLPQFDKVCVVGQTTQDERLFQEITKILKDKFPVIEIFDTVCDSTSMRQNELKELVSVTDAIIVVGGKNSANTTRLANQAREYGTPTFQVEKRDEVLPEMLKEFNRIGITAGASTPNWVFLDITEKVWDIQKNKMSFFKKSFLTLEQTFLRSNLFISLCAASLTYSNCIIQNIKPRFLYILLAFFYIFSMHVLNQFTEQASVGFNYPGKKHFYERHSTSLIVFGVLAGICSLILSIDLGFFIFFMLFLASLMGIIYQVKIIPDKWKTIFKYQRLKDVPASKDIFLSLAWIAVTVIFPLLGRDKDANSHGTFITILFTLIVVFARSIIYGIKEVQGDRMAGKETLPILLGEKKSKILIQSLSIFLFTAIIIFPIKGLISPVSFYLLISPLYILLYTYLYNKIVLTKNLFELVIDSSLLLPGLVIFLARYFSK